MSLWVDVNQLKTGSNDLSFLANDIKFIADKVYFIGKHIELLSYKPDSNPSLRHIGRNISRLANDLTVASNAAYILRDSLNSISNEYLSAEQKICRLNNNQLLFARGYVDYSKFQPLEPSIKPDLLSLLRIEPQELLRILRSNNSMQEKKEYLKSINSLYKLMFGIYGQLTGDLKGDGWKLGGALFSAFGLFLGAKSGDAPKSRLDLFRQFESMMGSEVSLLGKVCKIFKQKDLGTAYGIAGTGLGIVGELSKFAGYTVPESLKKMSGLIDKGGDLGKSIFDSIHGNDTDYNTKTVKDTNRDNLAAVKAMFSMGTYFAGDVMERSADGRYDINDYGGTLLETGINGMSSLTRSYTAGIVNLDANRATTIYNGVTDRVTGWIKSTNAPLPVQVAMTVPGAVVSASVSTVSVFIDHGMQIGEKINNVIGWFRK